jgi:hypothetical protein
VAGSLMADWKPPTSAYTTPIYRRVLAYMTERGTMNSTTAKAGCARCQACSGMSSMEPVLQIGRRPGA